MADTVAVPVVLTGDDGQQVQLYVEAESTGGLQEVGFSVVEGMDTAMGAIKAVAREVSDVLLAVAPDTFSVELGFDFKLEGGVLVALFAKTGGNASLKVTMEWKKA